MNDHGGNLGRHLAGEIAMLVPQAEKLTGKGYSMYLAEAAEARNIAELAEIRDELAEQVHTAQTARTKRWGEAIDHLAPPVIILAIFAVVLLTAMA